MFTSKFSQRMIKWIYSPKKFIINLEIQFGKKYTFIDIEVISRLRSQAIERAKEIAFNDVKIIVKGSKSLGKVRQLDEL